MGSGCVESIYQELYTVYLPDSEPSKLLYHYKQKPRRGGGLRQINTYAKSLYRPMLRKDDI